MSTAESDNGIRKKIEVKNIGDISSFLINTFLPVFIIPVLPGFIICVSLMFLGLIEEINGGILSELNRVLVVLLSSVVLLFAIVFISVYKVLNRGYYYE